MLKWIDELAYIIARIDFPDCKLVTVALDNVVFRHSINSVDILKFIIEQDKVGNTSLRYVENSQSKPEKILFGTGISFVNIDELGNKKSLGT